MLKKVFSVALAATVLWSCQNQEEEIEVANEMVYAKDVHSYAQPNTTAVEHLDLELDVDFVEKVLFGKATWTLSENHGETVVFDTYDINIIAVTAEGKALSFTLGDKDEILGQPLTINIPAKAKQITIQYNTNPGARALQWLDPEQTGGKKSPFLFTQSQAILARTWLPCQDSPGVRYTYNAEVSVPVGMLALMSASNPQEKSTDGKYHFDMEIPIPSYLMALSVGDISFKAVSDRTGVYAEQDMLEKSAWEFAEMEDMIVEAEALYGPYIWGRYDVLVLPPSFPFGGMENPRLTFATPTVVVGDRSQTSLIAHELAHSWSGNLVTNATWGDFWLNEGFTVYFEMRIMEAVYGRDYSEMTASISHQDMVKDLTAMMADEAPKTALKMKTDVENPDDGVSAVAYDKGYNFLRLCEETVGRERWDAWLKNYFTENKFTSMDTERFLEQLQGDLLTPDEASQIGLDIWIYGTGIPENSPVPQSPRFAVVDSLRGLIEKGATPDFSAVTDNWSTFEWVYFIRGIKNPTPELLLTLDNAYQFSASPNAEIMAAWMQPTIRNNYTANDFKNHVDIFLVNIGRRKFLTPTYQAMIESNQKDWALTIYAKARPNYHAVSRETMDALLEFVPEEG